MPNQDDEDEDEKTASGVVVFAAGNHRPGLEGKGRSSSKQPAGKVAAKARLGARTSARFPMHHLFLATRIPQYHSSHFPLTHLTQTNAFGLGFPLPLSNVFCLRTRQTADPKGEFPQISVPAA